MHFKFEWLPGFYAELRKYGFVVGVRDQRRIHELLLQLYASRAFPKHLHTLSNMFGAVLCTSEEQQRHFRQLFQSYFGSLLADWEQVSFSSEVDALPVVEGDGGQKSRRFAEQIEFRRFWARVAVALFCGVLLLVILPRLHQAHVTVYVQMPVRQVEPGMSQPPQVEPGISQPGQPPAPRDIQGPRETHDATSALGAGIVVFIFLPFAMLALWAAAPTRKGHAFATRRKVEGQPELFQLLLSTPAYNPFDCEGLHRAVQGLRRPSEQDSDDLDIDHTISESLRNGGAFAPRYARRKIAPEYLVLVERNGIDDHVARYADCLLAVLNASHVYTDVYYFEVDCRRVYRTSDGVRLSIEELLGRHGRHRLILISNGNGMLDHSSGEVASWVFQLTHFERRVCLTPTPAELWSHREAAIAKALDCSVVPLQPESFAPVVEILTADTGQVARAPAPETSAGARDAMNWLADLLEDRASLWQSSLRPPEALLHEFGSAARAALGSDGYRWLCACAVYPELSWNMTLHLGAALEDKLGEKLLTSRRLGMLAFLPWFRGGGMPTWFRMHLIASMSEREYRTAHQVIGKLFLTAFEFLRKNVALNLRLDRKTPQTVRLTDHLDATRDDTILAEFLSKAPRDDRSRFRLPATIGRYLLARKPAWIRGATKRPHAVLDEIRANSLAMRRTLEAAEVCGVRVVHGPQGEFGEHAGVRVVQALVDGTGSAVEMQDQYFLFLPTDASVAHLVDADTIALFLYRQRLVTRMALLNFVLMVLSATYLSGKVLTTYTSDAIAIAVVCSWIVVPFVAMHYLMLHRLQAEIRAFPSFEPKGAPNHKASRFELKRDHGLG